MTERILLTPEARADIVAIGLWYRERSVRAAEEFLLALGLAFARIEAQPTSNVMIDSGSGARRALLRKFPHRVLYLVEGEKIVVFAVMHHRRDAPAWQARLD